MKGWAWKGGGVLVSALILGGGRNSRVEPESQYTDGMALRPHRARKSGRWSRVDTGRSVETFSYFRCSVYGTGSLGTCAEHRFTPTAERFGEMELTCRRTSAQSP